MGAGVRQRIIGTCYLCRRPVRAAEAERVADAAVSDNVRRAVKRLAHSATCANELRGRVGRR